MRILFINNSKIDFNKKKNNKIGGIEGKQVDILKDLSAISERLKMTETLEDAYQKSTSKI